MPLRFRQAFKHPDEAEAQTWNPESIPGARCIMYVRYPRLSPLRVLVLLIPSSFT